jgi:hypothetical protein
VIFYGTECAEEVEFFGRPAAEMFCLKTTAYFQIPFKPIEMAAMYKKIAASKKPENLAVKLAASFKHMTSPGTLLHDLPYKNLTQKCLKLAEEIYGIKGSIEEVRIQLEKLRGKEVNQIAGVKNVAGDKVLPGLFCDIEGTLILGDKVNSDMLSILKKTQDKPVTLWTGGNVEDVRKILNRHGINNFPLVSKDVFRGCKVEIVYDDLTKKEFCRQYDIKAKTYIKVGR